MDKIQYDSKTVGSTVQNMEELSSDDKALAKDVKLMLQNKFENREKMPENNSILKSSSAKKIEIEDSDADNDEHNAFEADDFPTTGFESLLVVTLHD